MKKYKFWTYLNKKSYYAILLLCILTVIGTTTFITNNNMNTLDKVNEQNSIDLDEEFGDYDLEDVGTINAYQNDLNITEEDIEGAGSAVAENSSKEERQRKIQYDRRYCGSVNKEVQETTGFYRKSKRKSNR